MTHTNPLTMTGHVARCFTFCYRTDAALASRLLPPQLEPLTSGTHAFWSIAVSDVRAMRPKNLPAVAGFGYRQAAYRLHVLVHSASGPPIPALYFVRSDCDCPLLSGAFATPFDQTFHPARIEITESGARTRISVASAGASAEVALCHATESAHFAVSPFSQSNLPGLGISMAASGELQTIGIRRQSPKSATQLMRVEAADWGFLATEHAQLEFCEQSGPAQYQWSRATICGPPQEIHAAEALTPPQLIECGFF